MKYLNTILVLVAVLLLGIFSYWKLTRRVEQFKETETLSVEDKEYVWVRADSLSAGLIKYSAGDIEIDSSGIWSYTISYQSRQYLFHERIDGIDNLRKHLTSKENRDLMKDYDEKDDVVKISLKRKGDYVFCPALIVAWILREKSEENQR